MRTSARRIIWIVGLAITLAACGGGGSSLPTGKARTPDAAEVKVGKPYKVAGRWYYPKFDPYYDAVGQASWYGPKFHGRQTANGERFNMNALSAAHKTLPMPSFVRVTNLSNGRTAVLRVNDRGPFAPGRIIDVSRRAAQLLGFERSGLVRVRVQAVDANGRPYARNPNLVASSGSGGVAAPGPGEVLVVQIGAFSSRSTTNRVVKRLRGLGPLTVQTVQTRGGRLHRVRLGPFDTAREAEAVYREAVERGFDEARIFIDEKAGSR